MHCAQTLRRHSRRPPLAAGIFARGDPPKAARTQRWRELPPVLVGILIGCSRSTIDARYRFFIINARRLAEILPTLERDYFGHEPPPVDFRGARLLLHAPSASAPSGGRRRSTARHCTIDRCSA